ncbi:MAG TPA: LLM class flavin-dependent oxidoreductase, partial [Acidimicrobiales bacterium]|nr:LLM class flavin-dependent oxidoreductase [Acidimicrobiales bacterium]
MDVGLGASLSSTALRSVPPQRWAHAAAAAGFTSVWSLENPLTDQAEPLVFLTAIASTVPSLHVGTAALIAPVREPVLLARQCATLDHIAPGRLSVGVTIGRRAAEYALTGTDYHRRGRALDDVIAVLRQCWNAKPLHVVGADREWETAEAVGIPPATPGGPALLIGGLAPAARARAVTVGDGYLASATGGPRTALEQYRLIGDDLGAHGRSRAGFRMVANVFVHVGDEDRR